MSDGERESSSPSTGHRDVDALPVAPSMSPTLARTPLRRQGNGGTGGTRLLVLAVTVATLAALVAQVLGRLIDLVTNLAFYGRLSSAPVSPADNHLGAMVLVVPVVGGVLVGLLARYGSTAIRGHGIPEAMERVLQHEGKIPARMTWLKPLSAAIAIGTGGPFGAEGPIIATGGALGSLAGQIFRTSARERRTLLAAGAAAGMSATFGSPISAVLLAIELLLFELSPRSLVPVALAAATATGVRFAFGVTSAPFPMPTLEAPSSHALLVYVVLGAIVGVASVQVTRAVYAVEHIFEKLPIHWAFWPAIGAVAVGVVGFFEPHALGVGYDNIQHFLLADMAVRAVATLCILKFIAWVISLGSGTSGGTLAPLFTVGGGLGLVLGSLAASALPSWGIDPRVAALVGMAAMFAGASRALLASVVFAFETTRQPMGLLPLLGGCTAAYVVSYAMMHYSIMTRKIASRGVVVPHEYTPDLLDHAPVLQHTSKDVVTFGEDLSLEEARAQASTADEALASRGFAVVTVNGTLTALLTRDELRASSQPSSTPLRRLVVGEPTVLPEEALLRDAVEAMLTENVARLAVVSRDRRLLGVVTRHDVLLAYRRRWAEEHAERASSFLVRSKAGASRAALRDT